MQETEIRKYAGLMKELGLTGLEFTDDHGKIRLERSVATAPQETVYAVAAAEPAAQPTPAADKRENSVTSPFVGVFYAAPAENADPYVKVGDTVSKGQTLCIIEAMKLMNEITAETDGVISEICVTSGQAVEYGTELFRMKR